MLTVHDPKVGVVVEDDCPAAELVHKLLELWWEEQTAYALVVYDGPAPVVTLLGGEPEESEDKLTGQVTVAWAGGAVESYRVTYHLVARRFSRSTVDILGTADAA